MNITNTYIIELWGLVTHPNVVKLYELIEDNNKPNSSVSTQATIEEGSQNSAVNMQYPHDYLYLVIDFCDLGQIADWDNEKYEYACSQKVVDYVINANYKDKKFENEFEKIEYVAKYLFTGVLKGLEHLHSK